MRLARSGVYLWAIIGTHCCSGGSQPWQSRALCIEGEHASIFTPYSPLATSAGM